jgi:hypothetical protein
MDDGSMPVDAEPDGSPIERGCTNKWMAGPTFGTLRKEIGGDEQDQDVFVLPDDQTAFYHGNNGTLYMVQRTAGAWMLAVTPTGLDGPNDEVAKLTITSDRTVFVSTERGNSNNFNLYQSKLGPGGFSAPSTMQLGAVNASGDDIYDPHVTATGLRLYFSPLDGLQTIKVAERGADNADFGLVRTVPGLESGGSNADPTLTADERVIVFLSTRTGTQRMYYALRASPADGFSEITEIPTSIVGAAANSPHLSPDGCKLYFSTELVTDTSQDIYSMEID